MERGKNEALPKKHSNNESLILSAIALSAIDLTLWSGAGLTGVIS